MMFIVGCGGEERDTSSPEEKASLPTSGKVTIGVDESLRPVFDAEIKTFSVYYPNAAISPLYLPEKEVLGKLLANEIQTGFICRDFSAEEIDTINNNFTHSATSFKLAEDAIVSIVNKENPINKLSYDQLKKILSGEIVNWIQIDPAANDDAPIVVIMTAASSVDRFLSGQNALMKSFAKDTTTDVIDYVKANPSALGLVGGSWFYQKGSKYSDVKLIRNEKTDSSEAMQTSPGMMREVYAVNHEPYAGLGTGFISFIAAEKGQLILSKAGMTPYKPIVREIKLKDSFDK
jgi:phosphate transport system substrate-binding protein